jgi:hypothetical protein
MTAFPTNFAMFKGHVLNLLQALKAKPHTDSSFFSFACSLETPQASARVLNKRTYAYVANLAIVKPAFKNSK